MKTSNFWWACLATVSFLSVPTLCAQDSNVAGSENTAKGTAGSRPPSVNSPRLSRGITDLLKMQEQGIDKNVMRSFIENSTIAYQPTVEEIIYLHQQGLPDDLTTLLIHHGAQLRSQAPALVQPAPSPVAAGTDSVPIAAPAPAAPPVIVSAPAPVYSVPSTTYVYSEPYPVYGPSVSLDFGFWGAPYWRSYPHYRYGGFYGSHYVGNRGGGGFHGGGFGGSHGYSGGHAGGGHFGGGGGGHHR